MSFLQACVTTALVYGKGRKERVVPIGQTALRYTESYLTAVRPFLLRDRTEQAVFLDTQGKRLPYHVFRRLVHHYADALGIAVNVTPHTFRRSCTTVSFCAPARTCTTSRNCSDTSPSTPSSTTPNSPLPTCARRTANAIRESTETPEKAFPFSRSSGSFSAWASTLQTPLKRHRRAVLPHVARATA